MQTPVQPAKSETPSPFETLRKALDADALFAARGDIGRKGDVTIRLPCLAAINVAEDFVKGYAPLAPHDVVGILFAADARVVERVSASQYDLLKGAGNSKDAQAWNKKIRDYLRAAGFEHLILAGLKSNRLGLAWVVAYRGPLRRAFSESDAELARYQVPNVLFKALRPAEEKPDAALPSGKAAKGGLVPIDADRLRVAMLEAGGFGVSAIAERLNKSKSAIGNSLTYVRELLNIPEERQRITMQDLEHYAGQVSDEQALANAARMKRATKKGPSASGKG